jgi:hypothetical protein
MNRKLVALVGIISFLLVYPAVKYATAQPKPSFLFVQSAKKIDYKDGVMTLYDVPGQTIFFSDRPNRVVGNLPTDSFIAKWTTDKQPGGFAANPPNAAVTIFEPNGVRTAIVELTNPRMEGKNLAYNVKVLQGISPTTQPAEGVLFIDDYTGWAAQAFAGN